MGSIVMVNSHRLGGGGERWVRGWDRVGGGGGGERWVRGWDRVRRLGRQG